eukprot:TRINITY_DN1022_c0_g2_i1.p1 TRINITY_DN1022_c0_g2~~TRINITY_DN1022_c0_g2_i1.p1  ORF type:complete len:277 (+),score=73.79 TRINITY_DN1022_c0_g2_i1:273-1103(+)
MTEVEEKVDLGAAEGEKPEEEASEAVDPTSLVLEKKKKKKAKKKIILDDIDDTKEEGGEEEVEDINLELPKKKKKEKKKLLLDDELEGEDGEQALDDEEIDADDDGEGESVGQYSWSDSDRDYTYTELLDRVFNILKELNPSLSDRKRTILKPPQIAREGTKKTVFSNFMDMAKALNRSPEHLMNYLLAELGTSGSLDGQQRLIVKARFQPKNFEAGMRKYVNEYALCHSCKSVNTILDRDSATRLMHLKCTQCGAQRTVATIKQGFVARVTKRRG